MAKNKPLDDQTTKRATKHLETKDRIEADDRMRKSHEAWLERVAESSGLTAARVAKGEEVVEEETTKAGQTSKRISQQTALDRYKARGQISSWQYDAAQRLFRTWKTAGGGVRVTGSYGIKVDGQPSDRLISQIQAMERINSTMRYVGKQLSSVLVAVCLMDHSAQAWSTAQDDPPQAGIVVLRLALDRLVECYARADSGRQKKKKTR